MLRIQLVKFHKVYCLFFGNQVSMTFRKNSAVFNVFKSPLFHFCGESSIHTADTIVLFFWHFDHNFNHFRLSHCFTPLQIEYISVKYFSICFLFINLFLPHHNTNGQLDLSVSSRSFPVPILKYLAASSSVRLDFSHIGI